MLKYSDSEPGDLMGPAVVPSVTIPTAGINPPLQPHDPFGVSGLRGHQQLAAPTAGGVVGGLLPGPTTGAPATGSSGGAGGQGGAPLDDFFSTLNLGGGGTAGPVPSVAPPPVMAQPNFQQQHYGQTQGLYDAWPSYGGPNTSNHPSFGTTTSSGLSMAGFPARMQGGAGAVPMGDAGASNGGQQAFGMGSFGVMGAGGGGGTLGQHPQSAAPPTQSSGASHWVHTPAANFQAAPQLKPSKSIGDNGQFDFVKDILKK